MSGLKGKITVALGMDFLESFERIPRGRQAKVRGFITKFRRDPTSPGINFEKINVRDAKLRSVRIDQEYRGIVLKPDRGNVYLLLWIDHHDQAYRWAQNKVCHINPRTGSLQILDMTHVTPAQEPDEAPVAAEKLACLFDAVRDKDLLKLGVPEILLPSVRRIRTEQELEAGEGVFPREVYESLFYLTAGDSVADILFERDLNAVSNVDTEDFEAALARPETQRSFALVEDDESLERILSAPLEKWRVFLHPSQRKLVENRWNGPCRVLGGAGTGKTVVAMHRARFLAERVYTGPGEHILVTTFTRNLAADIEANLKTICSEAAMKRIEVVNLDRWVYRFLGAKGYDKQLTYSTGKHWQRAFEEAPPELDLEMSFYQEEWQKVVQPQGVRSLREYLAARRLGRGVRLSRLQRKGIWPVFERYMSDLRAAGQVEPEDAMRDAREMLEQRGDILPYRAVVVDEGQDMGIQAYRLIRAMVARRPGHEGDITIAGDAHQRIYRHVVTLSQCGINVRGRSRRLRVNYRTTEQNRRWAVGLLEGIAVDDLDGGSDSGQGYHSLMQGLAPQLRQFPRFEQEVAFIAETVAALTAGDEGCQRRDICLVARRKDLLLQYEAALTKRGVACYRVQRSKQEDRANSGLRLATMHRVKGLEFRHVFIAAVNADEVPPRFLLEQTNDATVRRALENQERALLYVAATRARSRLFITSHQAPSPFLVGLS